MEINLFRIYHQVKTELERYSPPLVKREPTESRFELYSQKKNITVEGRLMKEIYFAGLMIHKHHVGFYFMPVYTDEGMKKVFDPELLKLLKGKSCFHLRKTDGATIRNIRQALEAGFREYQEKGWV